MTKSEMLLSPCCVCLAILLLAVAPMSAQEPEGEMGKMSSEQAAMMEAWQKASTPGEPHEHLAESAGSWKLTIKMWDPSGGEPQVSEGTAERKMIMGGRHLEEHVEASAMGMPFEGYGLVGYDNVTGEYWGTWVDSMSTGLTLTTGTRDGDTWVWEGKTPDPMSGGVETMKIVTTREGDDREVSEFYVLEDGEQVKTMEIVYERQ